jgi:hypothetical protein
MTSGILTPPLRSALATRSRCDSMASLRALRLARDADRALRAPDRFREVGLAAETGGRGAASALAWSDFFNEGVKDPAVADCASNLCGVRPRSEIT